MDSSDQTDRLGSYRSRTAPAADIAAATRPVVDNKLLAEPLRQPLTHQARRDVGRAARRDWHDQPHRPRRVGLSPSEPSEGRQRGSYLLAL